MSVTLGVVMDPIERISFKKDMIRSINSTNGEI